MAVSAIHPGEHLAEELKEVGMSAAALARQLSVPTNRITGILNGQRAITGDTALRLAHFFGSSAEFWLRRKPATLSELCQHSRAASLCERNARIDSHPISCRYPVANTGQTVRENCKC